MRARKVWTVAAKELREFRSNRYILFTLLFMPLLLATILPFATFGPAAALGPSDEPLDLDPRVDGLLVNETVAGAVLVNLTIRDSFIQNSVILGSVVINSSLVGTTVEASVLEDVALTECLVRGSNVIAPRQVDRTSLLDSALLGTRGPDFEAFLLSLLDSYLLLFIVIPAAIPAVIASYSLVGEKAGRSLEPLLATPLSDGELLAGKSLSIFLPTMAVTWLAAGVFMVLANITVAPLLGFAPLPNAAWVVGVALLAPLFCLLSIGANVLVSSRVSDVRASQQLGTLVVLPAILLFFAVIFGAVAFGLAELLLFALLILAVDGLVGLLALKAFRREEILVSWK